MLVLWHLRSHHIFDLQLFCSMQVSAGSKTVLAVGPGIVHISLASLRGPFCLVFQTFNLLPILTVLICAA